MNLQSRSNSLEKEILANAEMVAQALSEPIVARMSESLPPDLDQAGYANVHRATGMVSVQMGIPVDDAIVFLELTPGRPINNWSKLRNKSRAVLCASTPRAGPRALKRPLPPGPARRHRVARARQRSGRPKLHLQLCW